MTQWVLVDGEGESMLVFTGELGEAPTDIQVAPGEDEDGFLLSMLDFAREAAAMGISIQGIGSRMGSTTSLVPADKMHLLRQALAKTDDGSLLDAATDQDDRQRLLDAQALLRNADPFHVADEVAAMPTDWGAFLALGEDGAPIPAAISRLTAAAWYALHDAEIAMFPSLSPAPATVHHLAHAVVGLARPYYGPPKEPKAQRRARTRPARRNV